MKGNEREVDGAKCIIFKCERDAAPVLCVKGCHAWGRPAKVEGSRLSTEERETGRENTEMPLQAS